MNIMFTKLAVMLILLATYLPVSLNPQPSAQQSASTTTQRSSPVNVGEMAPDLTLEDQDGRKVSLSSARGKRPVVLVFYRGYW